jgi:hypothetical protein
MEFHEEEKRRLRNENELLRFISGLLGVIGLRFPSGLLCDPVETTRRAQTNSRRPPPEDTEKLVEIARLHNQSDIDRSVAALEQAGIRFFAAEDDSPGAQWFGAPPIPIVRFHVVEADADRAIEILQTQGAEPPTGTLSRRHDPRTVVEFRCDSCSEVVSFPGTKRGSVQSCPHCGEYVDVPD